MRQGWPTALFLAAMCLVPAAGFAQSGIQPAGSNFTPGHTLRAMNPQGTVVGDAGGSAGSALAGQGYLTEIGITNTGTPFCINDALTNSPTGYHQLCMGAGGAAEVTYNAYGGATPGPLNFNINGANYNFPGTGTGNIVGPGTSVVGHVPMFNNATGTLMMDSTLAYGNTSPSDSSIALTIPGYGATGAVGGISLKNALGTTSNPVSWAMSNGILGGNLKYLAEFATASFTNTWGGMGLTGFARTSYGSPGGTMGLAGVMYNDRTSPSQGGWAGYFTATRASAGAAAALGVEIEVANMGNDLFLDPFQIDTNTSMTVPLWLACGGEAGLSSSGVVISPCSAAIAITDHTDYVNSNAVFDVGLSISQNSLAQDNGIPGMHRAIQMPNNYAIEWFYQAAHASQALIFANNDNSHGLQMSFLNDGINFQTGPSQTGGGQLFLITFVNAPINYPQVNASLTGQQVEYTANGNDGNVGILIAGKNQGHVQVFQADINVANYAVAGLPSCTGTNVPVGTIAMVGDAVAPTYGGTLTGGGTVNTLALCTAGGIWRAH